MADDMRTLGYICPKCGAQVMGARSVFALEASDAEIECSCGGSVLRTNYDGQNYHILGPCGVGSRFWPVSSAKATGKAPLSYGRPTVFSAALLGSG